LPLSIHPQSIFWSTVSMTIKKKGAVRRRLDMLRAKGLRIIEKGNPSVLPLGGGYKKNHDEKYPMPRVRSSLSIELNDLAFLKP